MTSPDLPRILPCGDAALAVEFGDQIDPAINAAVLALDRRLQEAGHRGTVRGVRETVPTYRSLLVHYDPVQIGFADLSADLLALAGDLDLTDKAGRLWRIPVVYGGEYGMDLEEVAARHGLTTTQLIDRHAAPDYRVYMIGFLPGYSYLGGLDPSIATPRRTDPRTWTPAGSISIGGIQALVASIEAPSGWHMLGRTPVRAFHPDRDPVFLLEPGDRVRFAPMAAERFAAMDRASAAGDPVAEVIG